MKALNFYSPSIEMQARMAANIVPGITDKQFLELEIRKWLTSQERHRQIAGDAYYDGVQPIMKRKRTVIGEGGELIEVENLPNNRLIDNQYAKMVDQKANYLCGQPITFDTKNAAYGEALSKVFGHKAQRTLRIVAEKALTGGKAWLFPYYKYRNNNPNSNRGLYNANKAVKELRTTGVIKATGTVTNAPKGRSIVTINEHAAKRMAERDITEKAAQNIIKSASFALKQRKGTQYAFYPSEGYAVLDNDGMLTSIGWLDEGGKKLYDEVMKNAGNSK